MMPTPGCGFPPQYRPLTYIFIGLQTENHLRERVRRRVVFDLGFADYRSQPLIVIRLILLDIDAG
jgi:hypothetical protein